MKLTKGALTRLESIIEELELSEVVSTYLRSLPGIFTNTVTIDGLMDFDIIDLKAAYADGSPYGVDKAPLFVLWLPNEEERNFKEQLSSMQQVFHTARPAEAEGEVVGLDFRFSTPATELENSMETIRESVEDQSFN